MHMQKQKRRSAAQLISAFVFATMYNSSNSEIRNVKPLAIFCGCSFRFVSGLVECPEYRVSRDAAHLVEQKTRVHGDSEVAIFAAFRFSSEVT